MAKLALHLSGEKQREVIREVVSTLAVIPGNEASEILADLAGQLPPKYHQELLDAARRVERHEWENWTNGHWRERAIIRLIPHFPEERRNLLIDAAYKVIVYKNRQAKEDDKGAIFREIAKLAPYSSRQQLKELMAFARSIRSDGFRLWPLLDLIPSLPADEKEVALREAMQTILAMPDRYDREKFLKAFAPFLSTPMLKEALTAVTAIGDEAYLIQELPKMLASLPAAEKEQALRLAMDVTRKHEWCAPVLADLAPAMSEAMQADALDLARGMKEPRFKARLLAGLIPGLADTEQDMALNQAQTALKEIDSNDRRPEDWRFLIRSLPPSKREQIVNQQLDEISYLDLNKGPAWLFHFSPFMDEADLESALRKMLSKVERLAGSDSGSVHSSVLMALKTLAPLLSEPLLGEMLSLTRPLRSDWHQNQVLSVFAKRLAETGDYRTALDVVKESDTHFQPALISVIPYLPKSMLAEAMNLALDPAPREYPLAELCGRLAEFGEVEKAARQARQLTWPNTRASALLAVAPYLSEDDRSRTLNDAMANALRIEDNETRRELLERSAPLLAQCSPATRSKLWREVLASLAKRARERSVSDLCLLTPVITAQAGQEGAAEVFRAIRDSTRWWP